MNKQLNDCASCKGSGIKGLIILNLDTTISINDENITINYCSKCSGSGKIAYDEKPKDSSYDSDGATL